MANSTTVIEIETKVTDETAEGVASAEKNLLKLEEALEKIQESLKGFEEISDLEITAVGVGVSELEESLVALLDRMTALNEVVSLGTTEMEGFSGVMGEGAQEVMGLSEQMLELLSGFTLLGEEVSTLFGTLGSFEELGITEQFSEFFGVVSEGVSAVSGFESGVSSALVAVEALGSGISEVLAQLSSLEGVSGEQSIQVKGEVSLSELPELPELSQVVNLSLGEVEGNLSQVFGSGSFSASSESFSTSISNEISNFTENISKIQESISSTLVEMESSFSQSVSTFQESGTAVGEFFSTTLTETVTTMLTEMESVLSESSSSGVEGMTEGVSQFLTVVMPEFFGNLWEEMNLSLEESGTMSLEVVSTGMTEFLTVEIPAFFVSLWEEIQGSMEEQGELAFATISERVTEFLGEFVPESLDTLWTETEMVISEVSLVSLEVISSGVSAFYGEFIPQSIQSIWDATMMQIETEVPVAISTISSGVSGFFASAVSSVNSFFAQAQSVVSSAMAAASAALSSLSISGGSSGGSVSAYANGGILTKPHMGLVAEDGPEAIIPLSGKRRSRGIALWEEAGEKLGVYAYGNGGIVGQSSQMAIESQESFRNGFGFIEESESGGTETLLRVVSGSKRMESTVESPVSSLNMRNGYESLGDWSRYHVEGETQGDESDFRVFRGFHDEKSETEGIWYRDSVERGGKQVGHREFSSQNQENVSVNVGDVILTVNVDGAKDGMSIVSEVKEHLGDLTDEIALRLGTSLGKVFENMPLVVEV